MHVVFRAENRVDVVQRVKKKSPVAKKIVKIRNFQIVHFSPFKCMKIAATNPTLIVATIIATVMLAVRLPKST